VPTDDPLGKAPVTWQPLLVDALIPRLSSTIWVAVSDGNVGDESGHEVKELNAVVTILVRDGCPVCRHLQRGTYCRDAIARAAVAAADQRATVGQLRIALRPSGRLGRRLVFDTVDSAAFPGRLAESDRAGRLGGEFMGGAFAPGRHRREYLRRCRPPASDPVGCGSLYRSQQVYPLTGLLGVFTPASSANILVATYGPRSTDRRCVTPCA
jgi:hypothetical protein